MDKSLWMKVKGIYVSPCDILEAWSGTSDKIFAIRTTEVTQQFPTYMRYHKLTIIPKLSKSFSFLVNLQEAHSKIARGIRVCRLPDDNLTFISYNYVIAFSRSIEITYLFLGTHYDICSTSGNIIFQIKILLWQ